jgi:ribosomal protein L11 methyltransferase
LLRTCERAHDVGPPPPVAEPKSPVVDHHRYVLPVRPDEVEVRAAVLWAAGARGVWERPGELVAWFTEDHVALPDSVAGGAFALEPDRDWQADWKATISPVRAGRIVVVPTWLADDHRAATGETTLVLDPGRAFGSGHHATTTLCLELLDELDLDGRTLVDVGCGSGVLAIAAATRGAHAVGSDIDPDAVEVTGENAARNGVTIPAAVGSVRAALALAGSDTVDVVVANLVTDTVVALADDLVRAVAAGGSLVASGIAEDREDVATTALRTAGLTVDDVRRRDGWIALRGQRTTVGPRDDRTEVASPPSRR